MDYIIKNNNDAYVRINSEGQVVTCGEKDATRFSEYKAKNLLKHMPKKLKNLHFYTKCVPDFKMKTSIEKIVDAEKVNIIDNIEDTIYTPSESIIEWVDKFGRCYDIFHQAKQRYNELIKLLYDSDSELMDILHDIELGKAKDLYSAWLTYKKIRKNRKKRREYKDEMMIIHNVLEDIDESKVSRERTKRAIAGLFNRKYTYRIVEVDENGKIQDSEIA